MANKKYEIIVLDEDDNIVTVKDVLKKKFKKSIQAKKYAGEHDIANFYVQKIKD